MGVAVDRSESGSSVRRKLGAGRRGTKPVLWTLDWSTDWTRYSRIILVFQSLPGLFTVQF